MGRVSLRNGPGLVPLSGGFRAAMTEPIRACDQNPASFPKGPSSDAPCSSSGLVQKYRGSLFALRRACAEVVLAAPKQHPFVFSYRVRFVGNTGTSPHGESPATRFPASSTRPETDNLVKRVFGKYPLGGLGKLEHKPPSSAGFMGKLPRRQRHPKQARDARKQHGRCDSP